MENKNTPVSGFALTRDESMECEQLSQKPLVFGGEGGGGGGLAGHTGEKHSDTATAAMPKHTSLKVPETTARLTSSNRA